MVRALALCLALLAGPADACRLALALGVDVSGSVIGREYRLQLSGIAAALRDDDVQAAILSVPGQPVALAVYEWSGSEYQLLIRDWVLLTDALTIDLAAAEIEAWGRRPAPEATGIGAALRYGAALLDRAPGCARAVLDVSGDGENNDWPQPRRVLRTGVLDGATVNALVVTGTDAETAAHLKGYFETQVLHGPGAFLVEARGYEDYARAMRLKLLRELESIAIGALDLE